MRSSSDRSRRNAVGRFKAYRRNCRLRWRDSYNQPRRKGANPSCQTSVWCRRCTFVDPSTFQIWTTQGIHDWIPGRSYWIRRRPRSPRNVLGRRCRARVVCMGHSEWKNTSDWYVGSPWTIGWTILWNALWYVARTPTVERAFFWDSRNCSILWPVGMRFTETNLQTTCAVIRWRGWSMQTNDRWRYWSRFWASPQSCTQAR